MRRRKKVVLLGLLVCIVAVAVVSWRQVNPQEPQYQGKPLSYWVLLNARPIAEGQFNPARAIAEIGTNGLPYLLRWIHQQPYSWQRRARAYRNRNGLVRKLLPYWTTGLDRENRAKAALEAIQCLGSSGAAAIPHLLPLAANAADLPLAQSATTALSRVGPEALPVMLSLATNRLAPGRITAVTYLGVSKSAAAVPALVQCVDETNDPVSVFAARALGDLGLEPAVAVPALIRYLQRLPRHLPQVEPPMGSAIITGQQRLAAFTVVSSLQRYGTNANAAVPELLGYLASTSDNDPFCVQILHALSRITVDPAAAAPTLTNYLQSTNMFLRNSAARLLSGRTENGRMVITNYSPFTGRRGSPAVDPRAPALVTTPTNAPQ